MKKNGKKKKREEGQSASGWNSPRIWSFWEASCWPCPEVSTSGGFLRWRCPEIGISRDFLLEMGLEISIYGHGALFWSPEAGASEHVLLLEAQKLELLMLMAPRSGHFWLGESQKLEFLWRDFWQSWNLQGQKGKYLQKVGFEPTTW